MGDEFITLSNLYRELASSEAANYETKQNSSDNPAAMQRSLTARSISRRLMASPVSLCALSSVWNIGAAVGAYFDPLVKAVRAWLKI